jgi:hypothetical protein
MMCYLIERKNSLFDESYIHIYCVPFIMYNLRNPKFRVLNNLYLYYISLQLVVSVRNKTEFVWYVKKS